MPPGFWNIVEGWAGPAGYKCTESIDGGTRIYQKGVGFWVAPMMLQLTEANGQVSMEAWIRAGLFVRICSLFILPPEIGIESGGFKAVLPRKIARGKINDLLQALGQPPIP